MPILPPTEQLVASSLSQIFKLAHDERINLQKLLEDEKFRAFNEEVDLKILQSTKVQLVAWIRFHTIYQSGRMHVRFLKNQSGPIILLIYPNEIATVDSRTCDIQKMQGEKNAPEMVKKLLQPNVSPEDSSLFAALLCDGVKWELVGLISFEVTEKHRTPPPAISSVVKPKFYEKRQQSTKQSVVQEFPKLPEFCIDDQREEEAIEKAEMKQLRKLSTLPVVLVKRREAI